MVESYKFQCYNYQKFGHVWANCKQPPRCMRCGGGNLHRDCPERENAFSTPACCNCQLAERETAYPANYHGCKHAKEEMRKKKPQGKPKTTTGRVFATKFINQSVSFAAALRGHAEQKTNEEENGSASKRDSVQTNTKQQQTGQSVPAPSISNEPEDNMIRVVTAVRQIMRELKGAASEKAKIMAIINIVYNLLHEDDK
jgi:hypothetical protein